MNLITDDYKDVLWALDNPKLKYTNTDRLLVSMRRAGYRWPEISGQLGLTTEDATSRFQLIAWQVNQ